ncbi:MAG: amino acid ABC transporter substrate-binding protein [Firmicutes bacterium]|nr:amino acid ABC transporter substrate-binding protein [Bacillota bacterium]
MKFSKLFVVSSVAFILALALVVTGCSKEPTSSASQNGPVAEDTWERIQKDGKMVVGLDDTFAPFGFRNDKNELVGFDIDLGEALAKRLGIKIEWQPAEWSGVVMSLKTGKFDAIWSGMSITPEREAEVNFTTPYIGSAQVIVVLSDNTEIKGKDDLAGKVIGTQLGSTGEVACKKLQGLKELKTYDVYTEALNDLKTGRLNAVVTDDITARYYFQQQPGTFKILDDILSYEPMGIAIRKEDATLLDVLNKEIQSMIEDGTYKAISEKWFGEDMSQFLNN